MKHFLYMFRFQDYIRFKTMKISLTKNYEILFYCNDLLVQDPLDCKIIFEFPDEVELEDGSIINTISWTFEDELEKLKILIRDKRNKRRLITMETKLNK